MSTNSTPFLRRLRAVAGSRHPEVPKPRGAAERVAFIRAGRKAARKAGRVRRRSFFHGAMGGFLMLYAARMARLDLDASTNGARAEMVRTGALRDAGKRTRAAWRLRMAARHPRPAREHARRILRDSWLAGPALYLPWARAEAAAGGGFYSARRANETVRWYLRHEIPRAFRRFPYGKES